MLSKVIGVYRLAAEPELKYLSSGTELCKLNLVNSSKYKKQDGTVNEETCFIEGTCFSGLAKTANQYLKKGSKIYVVAELKQDTWTDNEGKNRSKHSLKIESFEMLDSKPNDNQSSQGQYQNQGQAQQHQRQEKNIPEINIDEFDETIPF